MKSVLALFGIIAAVIAWHCCDTPPPVSAPSAAPAAVAMHRTSADDVFYLRQYLSVPTGHGLAGWTPGQIVRLDVTAPAVDGKVAVTDGTIRAVLDPLMLTHDIDEAQALAAGDQQSQATMIAQADRARAKTASQRMAAQIESAQNAQAASTAVAAGNMVGTAGSRLRESASYDGYGGGSGGGGGSVYYGSSSTIIFEPGSLTAGSRTAGASDSSIRHAPAVSEMPAPVRPRATSRSAMPMRPDTTPYPGPGSVLTSR